MKPVLGNCVSLEERGIIPTDCLENFYRAIERDLKNKGDIASGNILTVSEILNSMNRKEYPQLQELVCRLGTALEYFEGDVICF